MFLRATTHAAAYEASQQRGEEAVLSMLRYEDLKTLAGGISHEVNNPLTAIRSGLRVLQKKYMDFEVTFEDQKILDVIDKNIGVVSDIINSLRDYARDYANEPCIDVEISRIVKIACSLYQRTICVGWMPN